MTKNQKCEVWVVDDDKSIRWVLDKALTRADFDVKTFDQANLVLNSLDQGDIPHCILSDIRMPGIDGLELLDKISIEYPELPVIIMTAHSDLDSAVNAYEGGAFEYLPKPFDVDVVVEQVTRACRHSMKNRQVVAAEPIQPSEIIGKAPAMQEVFRAIGRLSRSPVSVLITGESGTGKERVAQALHKHSIRANKPFVALNTAAIPRELLESELFGHEKGAFTGATSRRKGRFEQADKGTLFLDEIGDMPADLQTRLLRVLADGEFYPIGAHIPIKVDVRIIAATHQDLNKLVLEGQFREDLFHRLNVIRIHIPALRERNEDIELLMEHFLLQASIQLEIEKKQLTPECIEYLATLNWPGNVRQLENTARWLTVMASGQLVDIDDLPEELKTRQKTPVSASDNWQSALELWVKTQLDQGGDNILDEALPIFEKTLIMAALEHTSGKKQEAAKVLGWGRNTLTRKLKELGIN